MKNKPQNIYQFYWPENTDWVYAQSKIKAIFFYKSLNDMSDSDLEECEISRVKKSNWDKCHIIDPDTGLVEQTFTEWVKEHGDDHADMICTTAY